MPTPANLPRRTIQELLAIHRFESAAHDVIVEGSSDRAVVEWFLEESARADFAVYEIDLFEVEAERVRAYQLETNNRGRLIALGFDLAAHLDDGMKVTCIADRDFDLVLNREHECGLLLMTDFTCMVMYTFNERVLNKYLRLRLRRFPKPASQVIQEISGVLQRLFAVRLANYLLRLNLQEVAWERSCTLDDTGVVLDVRNYVMRYLNKNARLGERERFMTSITECERQMLADPRYQVKGHDFISVLIWYISQHRGYRAFGRKQEEAVEQELFSCLEQIHLAQEPLFRHLLARVEGA